MYLNFPIMLNDQFPMAQEAIKRALSQFDFDLRCAAPGIIQSFDETTQTVTVQLAIKELIYIDVLESKAIPQLGDVPLVIPRAGNFVITVPPKKGDECLVVFADTCIDSWWKSGEETGNPNSFGARDPMSLRRHDLSDAFAILGTWSQPKKIETYATDCMEIRTLDGTKKVQITDDIIKIIVNENTYIEVTDGTINIKTSDALNIDAEGDVSVLSAKNVAIESSGGTVDITSSGDMTIDSSGKLDVTSSGNMTLESSGNVVVDSSSITLGSGTTATLLKDTVIDIFNNHTHNCKAPGSPSGTPIPPNVLTPGVDSTTNTEAS